MGRGSCGEQAQLLLMIWNQMTEAGGPGGSRAALWKAGVSRVSGNLARLPNAAAFLLPVSRSLCPCLGNAILFLSPLQPLC